ncbi:hypothetical protein LSH36_54g04031 [Paralvinella palmiformis]|uniref:Uncharacterized protein n=1 Tax=Paralvinella palmiformis TaxID=53620 RepID=A0AAD9NCE2_9ANNE|nr:hypothetical protein LSH36_54g04031 [Paralvinella palmiformis]
MTHRRIHMSLCARARVHPFLRLNPTTYFSDSVRTF